MEELSLEEAGTVRHRTVTWSDPLIVAALARDLSALVYPGTERREFHVILNSHLDVVPAPPDQFRPRRDGDRLFARGAQDMKVTGLLAVQVFRELAPSLPYPVALQLVTDEEAGGRDGTRYQLEHGVRGRFGIVGEASGLRI